MRVLQRRPPLPLVSPIKLHQKRRLTSAIMSQEEEQPPPLNLPKIKEDFLVGSTGGSGGFSFWKSKDLLPRLKVAKRRKKSGLSRKSDQVDETVVEEENKTDNLGTALEARREALTRPGFFSYAVWRRAK